MNREFLKGAAKSAGYLVAIAPFGFVAGTAAAAAGLSFFETMGWTLIISSGAAMLAALQLLTDGAPALIAVLTGLCIGLRLVMYSASIAPHLRNAPLPTRLLSGFFLTDQAYAVAIGRFDAEPTMSDADKSAFYLGGALPIIIAWHLCVAAGYLLGATAPAAWELDFLIPLCFIAIIGPYMTRAPAIAAACAAAGVSLALRDAPLGLNVMAGGTVGVVVGAALDRARERASA